MTNGGESAPLSPLATLILRFAPDTFLLTKPNTFQHNREASVANVPMVFGIIPEGRSASLRNERSASPGSPVNSPFHRFLSIMSGVALCVISGSLIAQQAQQPAQPASPGITTGVVDSQRVGGVEGFPYSAEEITVRTQTLADGTHITLEQMAKVYQESEGRTRREEYSGPSMGTPGEENSARWVHIFDPVAGVDYSLNPRDHTAHKTELRLQTPPPPPPTTGGSANPRHAPDRPRPTHENLGTQVMEGIEVRGTRLTTTIPVGAQGNDQPIQVTTESWYSPELHLTIMHTSNDPRHGETVRRLRNVVRDEPPATLFQVPPDYTIEETQTVVTPPPVSE